MAKLRGIPCSITFCAVLALGTTAAPTAAQEATFYQHLDYSGASFNDQDVIRSARMSRGATMAWKPIAMAWSETSSMQ